MRKVWDTVTAVLWLIIIIIVGMMLWRHGSFNHINVTFYMMHTKSMLGWLVTITMFITAIDFLYYHLINPKKK